MKTTVVFLAVFSIAFLFVGNGCKTADTALSAGDDCKNVVQNTTNGNFNIGRFIRVQSGGASATPSCPVTYKLRWRWANLQRAATDNTMPPLSDLAHAFGISFTATFSDVPAPVVTHSDNPPQYEWSITFSEHYAQSPVTFTIQTSPSSNKIADSVWANAEVDANE